MDVYIHTKTKEELKAQTHPPSSLNRAGKTLTKALLMKITGTYLALYVTVCTDSFFSLADWRSFYSFGFRHLFAAARPKSLYSFLYPCGMLAVEPFHPWQSSSYPLSSESSVD